MLHFCRKVRKLQSQHHNGYLGHADPPWQWLTRWGSPPPGRCCARWPPPPKRSLRASIPYSYSCSRTGLPCKDDVDASFRFHPPSLSKRAARLGFGWLICSFLWPQRHGHVLGSRFWGDFLGVLWKDSVGKFPRATTKTPSVKLLSKAPQTSKKSLSGLFQSDTWTLF